MGEDSGQDDKKKRQKDGRRKKRQQKHGRERRTGARVSQAGSLFIGLGSF
jgi:hypothetical protein